MLTLDPEKNIAWHFELRVREHPTKIAVETATKNWTYQEINDTANAIAHQLVDAGIKPGSRIILCLRDAFLEAASVLGIWKAACAFVPLDPKAPVEFNTRIMAATRPHGIVTNHELKLSLEPAAISRGVKFLLSEERPTDSVTQNLNLDHQPDTIARIVFTSGSTGIPKGVENDQRGMLYRAATSIAGSDFQIGERQLNLSPLAHVTGSTILLNTFLIGGTLSCYPLHQRGVEFMGEWIRDKQITRFATVPTVFRRFMRTKSLQPAMLQSLRTVYLGAEPTRWTDVELFRKFCGDRTKLICNIGSTETGPTVRYEVPPGQSGPGELVPLGYPYPDLDFKLLDENGVPVASGETGEITVRSRNMARGYFEDPAETARRFEFDPHDPTLVTYRTGDQGRFDAHGVLHFEGRLDRQIKINGHRVQLDHITSVLIQHPVIDAADTITWPDATNANGFLIAAYFTTKPSAPLEPSELSTWLRQRLPLYMVPRYLQRLDKFTFHSSGKINRRALPSPPPPSRDPISTIPTTEREKTILHWWRGLLESDSFGVEDNFFAAGGDSLLATRLIIESKDILSQKIALSLLFHAPTPRRLAAALQQPLAKFGNWIEIKASGTKAPLVCCHGWAGEIFLYQLLGHSLNSDRKVFAIQSNEHSGNIPPPRSIGEMVTQYADLIASKLPGTPCVLAGYSMGGSFAFAIAAELDRRKHPVEQVIIIDSMPKNLPPLIRAQTVIPGLWRSVKNQTRLYSRGELAIGFGFITNTWARIRSRFRDQPLATTPINEDPSVDYYGESAKLFQIEPHALKLSLIHSEQTFNNLPAAWGYLSKNQVRRITIAASHSEMVSPPHIMTLREKLELALLPPR